MSPYSFVIKKSNVNFNKTSRLKELFYISNILAAFNSFGLFGLLLLKKKASTSNLALGAILIIPALYFVNSILLLTVKQINIVSNYFFFAQTVGAFFPAAVYVFTYTLLNKRIKKLNIIFICSILISLMPISYFVTFLNLTKNEQILFFQQLRLGKYPESITLYNVVFYAFQQLVFAWVLKELYHFKRTLQNTISTNTIKTRIYYLQLFLWAFFSLNTFLLIASLFFDVLLVEYLLLPISLIILHSSTIYFGFKNPEILSEIEFKNDIPKHEENKESVRSKSKANKLTDDELARLESKIINGLNEKSIYKDPEISLAKMANAIDIPAYKVSITINEKMDTTFFDLINSKRIEASLDLLKDNELFTIEAIALEVGFKSKSTFYRAFKKHMGATPSQYFSKQ